MSNAIARIDSHAYLYQAVGQSMWLSVFFSQKWIIRRAVLNQEQSFSKDGSPKFVRILPEFWSLSTSSNADIHV
jgi:hypothetical protein